MITLKRVSLFLLLTTVFAHSAPLSAQWQTSASVSYNITCVRFLQDEGAKLTPPQPLFHKGLIGGLQHISYCISASGASWNSASVPSSWNDGYVSDFAFKDTLNGWAAIYGANSSFYNNSQVSGILKTSDGGVTWSFVSGAPAEVRGLYYSPVTHRLFVSSGDVDDLGGNGTFSGAWTSTNDGATWSRINVTTTLQPGATPYNQRCYYTGFASWDGMHIVLASEGGPNPCVGESIFDLPFWLHSSDGGLTWETSSQTARSWQPVALKNTSQFYASSYDRSSTPPTNTVITSGDNGRTWKPTIFGQTATGAVTEVMGGDPCLLVVPDSNVPVNGNYYSGDDAQTWSTFGSNDPVPPIDMRNYVGGDSVWLFSGTHLYSTARPASNPVHFSDTSVSFLNSGCYTSSKVISMYGCNCTPPTTENIQITGSSVAVASGANNFSVVGLSSGALCGPSSFTILYTPNAPTRDSSYITINYTVNGGAHTYTIPAFGNGRQVDFTTNWGSKAYPQGTNAVIFKTVPCADVDTFLTIYNPTCADIQLIMFDTSGGAGIIWYNKSDVPLPITIHSGDSVTIPIHASTTKNGTYQVLISIKTNSGGTIVEKHFFVDMVVNGPQVKPFVRGFEVHVPYACNGKGFDSAVYYFDTTCLPAIISNIHLKNQSDPNFELDLSKLHFPDTLHPLGDGTGTFFLRAPIHFKNTEPGSYSDSVIFEDQLSDGTILRTAALVRYKIDKSIDYTPIALNGTSFNFGTVTPCDSGRTHAFHFLIHDTCAFPDTLSTVATSLAPGYKILHMPPMNTTFYSGQADSLVIAWPDGYALGGQTRDGTVQMWFRNGIDSNSITYRFYGFVSPCNIADVRKPSDASFSIHSDGKQLLITLDETTPATFELQNLLGERILTTTVTGSASIDDRSLAAGVYFYRVTMGDRILTGKITLP
jgi:hypothetical protein